MQKICRIYAPTYTLHAQNAYKYAEIHDADRYQASQARSSVDSESWLGPIKMRWPSRPYHVIPTDHRPIGGMGWSSNPGVKITFFNTFKLGALLKRILRLGLSVGPGACQR